MLPPNTTLVGVLGFVAGLGLGTVMPITTLVVQNAVGRSRLGAATATVSLARSTGAAAGAALFGAIVFAMVPDVDRYTILEQAGALGTDRILDAFHRAFFCAAGVAALAVYVATRMPRDRLWPSTGESR